MSNPYKDALEKEIEGIDAMNPFPSKTEETPSPEAINIKVVPEKKPVYENKRKSNNYFNLILDSSLEDIELEIRGMRKVQYRDSTANKMIQEYGKKPNHYLTDEGADFLVTQLKLHIPADMKLAHITQDEFKITMSAFQEQFFDFIQDHMNILGMESYDEQNKGILLGIAIVNRVRAVYSRSIGGVENRRSHEDITISGKLEGDREDKFSLEETRN